ncbi:MAG: hypothetical protein CL691_03785 [Cellvibrionales bacterium]|nr:hypothetical protein [Cellvibrionales bacterium]|tara:strand:- start:2559 stop:3236 length:678 start_codon:yes stop_codon:yes gene_type:complete
MKTLVKAIAIASLASTAAVAQAEVSATLGVNSSYMFRGFEMADGNTTYASVGFDLAGLAVGVTVTDSDGSSGINANTETDIAIGYSMNVMGTDVRLSYTDYEYNFGQAGNNFGGDDDGTGQTEFSVGITASGVSIDFIDGEDDMSGSDVDFDVLTLGYSVGNVDITIGKVDVDGSGEYNYYEIGTGTELFGLDASVTVTNTFSEDDSSMESGATLVVGVSKSLNL